MKEMFENYPDVLKVEELMQMLHIGRNRVYELLSTNAIRSIKLGRRYIIPKTRVIEFLENHDNILQ